MKRRCLGEFITVAAVTVMAGAWAEDGNRFTYLDESDPYYVSEGFPRLETPQWIGEAGVEAAVILSIDDMRDTGRYEEYLRPILDRLKAIDGRAALSIMACEVDPADPRLQAWLAEGVSIETHTASHPCPLLGPEDSLAWSKADYDACVEQMASIPNNTPRAFRTPCCDSLNTASPRLFAEVFNGTTPGGRFLEIDSSVFTIPAVEGDRFRKYLPFDSFVNTIEGYPYPYVIGRLMWEIPCTVPSDWEGHHLHGSNDPRTVADMKAALDDAVARRGVYVLVFHPHGWIRNDQVVAIIDHAVERHGSRVKFLTFGEAADRMAEHVGGGQRLRNGTGGDHGTRLLDLNGDGYMDVVIGNGEARVTRVWDPDGGRWVDSGLPFALVDGEGRDAGVRFGAGAAWGGWPVAIARTESMEGAWVFSRGRWRERPSLVSGLAEAGVYTALGGMDQGVRLLDLDGDGTCELLVASPDQQMVLAYRGRGWRRAAFAWPEGVRVVDGAGRDGGARFVDLDGDGRAELVFSNEERFGVYRFAGMDSGWETVWEGERDADGAIPPIAVGGVNGGAWFHSGYLWVQNEHTDGMADHVDRRGYGWLLGEAR